MGNRFPGRAAGSPMLWRSLATAAAIRVDSYRGYGFHVKVKS